MPSFAIVQRTKNLIKIKFMPFSTANVEVQLAKRLVSELLSTSADALTRSKLNELASVLNDLHSQIIASEYACAMGKDCKEKADSIITMFPSQTD
jgi:hypothetical protein